MKRKLLYVLMWCSIFYGADITQSLYDNATHKAMPLLLGIMPEGEPELQLVAKILAKNLERSGQFSVTIKEFKTPTKKSELDRLFDKKYPLEIFLNHLDDRKAIGWRLYDVPDKKLVKGRKYTKRGSHIHGYADNLTDDLWPVLTSQPSSFSSKLAYVKKRNTISKKDRQRSIVCISNTDGSHEQIIIPKMGTYVSLYWHHDTQNPCLFCSEFTRYNVRFISTNLQRRKKIVLNLQGTCVGISVAHDNNKAVYCRSGTIWEYSYDPVKKQGIHKVLISNDGKNVSPTLLDNGDIIFCSDSWKVRKGSKSWGPKICWYHARDKSISLITKNGYCVGPSYCKRTGKVAYSKKINGTMQLCVYDSKRNKDTQLTFDKGNKIDCCWSPCGNYLVYCCQRGRTSQIAVMHVAMKKIDFVTPRNEYCSCPSWSPVYSAVPVLG